MRISKNRKKLFNDFDINKTYEPLDAIKILKDKSYVKFDETVEVSVNLNIDSNKTDQNIKGVINLPKGTGKDIKVAVITSEDKQNEAIENKAFLVFIQKLRTKYNFDYSQYCYSNKKRSTVSKRLKK